MALPAPDLAGWMAEVQARIAARRAAEPVLDREGLRRAGVLVPHYCYHPHLSIAGNCRMCLVEIEAGGRGADIACNMGARDGLAIRTDNAKVAHLCEPLSPAIFKVLHMVLDACRRTGTPVTVCGEMAGQPRSVLVLFGMGLRRFSMSPAFVPTIKAVLNSVTTAQAERFAHQVLQLKTSEEIRSYLNARLHEVSSDLELFDFT